MIRDTEIQVLSPVLSFLEDRAEDGDDWAEYPGFSADPVANTGTSAWKTICPAHFLMLITYSGLSLNFVRDKLDLIGAVCMASYSRTQKWMLNLFE